MPQRSLELGARLVLIAGLGLFLAGVTPAQQNLQPQPRNTPSQFPAALGSGLPPLQPIPPAGSFGTGIAYPVGPRNGFGRYGYGYPGAWGGYGLPSGGSPITNVVVVEQPPVLIPPTPPTPARSEVREYKFSSAPDTSIDASELQLFVIVMKDGTRHFASAVWTQGSNLQFIDENGTQKRAPLNSVDRDATRKLNQTYKLNLRIP